MAEHLNRSRSDAKNKASKLRYWQGTVRDRPNNNLVICKPLFESALYPIINDRGKNFLYMIKMQNFARFQKTVKLNLS